MTNLKGVRFYLFIISIFLLVPMVVAQGLNVSYDNPNVPRVVITPPGASPTFSNASFNVSFGDDRYWCLNQTLCGKTPLSDWNMANYGLGGVGNSTWLGNILMRFSASIQFNSADNNISSDAGVSGLYYRAKRQHNFVGLVNITQDLFVKTFNLTSFLYNQTIDGEGFDENGNFTLNGTWVFNENTTFNDNIYMETNTNISFPNNEGCIVFPSSLGQLSNFQLCHIDSATSIIQALTLLIKAQTTTIGNGVDSTITIGIDTSGSDGSFAFDGANNYWEFSKPITWNFLTNPEIVPSNLFPNSNISFYILNAGFNPVLMKLSNMGLNVSSAHDVCIEGGNCLSRVNESLQYNMTTGSGGDTFINITNNITFVSRPLISITTTADGINSLNEINPFDQNNYSAYSYVNNTDWNNVTYYSVGGKFQAQQTGQWEINPLIITRISSSNREALLEIRVNGVSVYSHIVAQVHASVDPELLEANIIRNLNAGDNVTVVIDMVGVTVFLAPNDGTTMNMVLLDSPVTDTGGGGQNYLSIQATGTGNTVAEPANPFASSNYTGYGFHNFADSGTITYDSTLGVFTVPSTDQYKIEIDADGSTQSGYTFGRINIYINGFLNKTSISQTFDSSGEEEWGTSASAIISLNANDNITVGLLGHSGSPSCPCSFNIGEFNGISINNI